MSRVAVIGAGAVLGNRCFLGEGALIPPGSMHRADSVLVGRPARRIRSASERDLANLRTLRGGHLDVPDTSTSPLTPTIDAHGGSDMGQLYAYRDRQPTIGDGTVLFDTAEITGDVHIGTDCVIGAGVKIIGDSHGPVRIGDRVQILENTVLHLLPDNELVIEDGVFVGPGSMIHGCHIGERSVIEPAAIVCDGATIGAGSHVTMGSLVRQRSTHPDRAVLDGFPAAVTATLDADPPPPGWALDPADLPRRVLG